MSKLDTGRERVAFTLVELLSVIAVIAILAAILIPVSGHVRESARKSECLSNLRQIGVGMLLYSVANGNTIPAGFETFTGSSNQQSQWGYKVWPYIYPIDSFVWPDNDLQHDVQSRPGQLDNNVFHCPSSKLLGADVGTPHDISVGQARFSYGLNFTPASLQAMDEGKGWSVGMRTPTKVYLLEQPGSTVMVAEASDKTTSAYHYNDRNGLLPHEGSANFLFFDGHVESLGMEDIADGNSDFQALNDEARLFWGGR